MRPGAKRGPLVVQRSSGEGAVGTRLILALLAIVAFAATYSVMSALHSYSPSLDLKNEAAAAGARGGEPGETDPQGDAGDKPSSGGVGQDVGSAPQKKAGSSSAQSLCRGMEHLELWGDVVAWGTSNLVDTAEDCCRQCQGKCRSAEDCGCNSWVFCGNRELCRDTYKQCWLKKQEDVLKPDVHGLSADNPWTSGIVHAPGKGIVALSTDLGSIRIRLEPGWAPLTVSYVRDLLHMKYCTGCQLYRAEGLGEGWNPDGTRTSKPPGPPYALIQGTLQTDGLPFKPIPREATPAVKRGYACLVGEGPDFVISLADHSEWGNAHTVFGRVPEEDLQGVVQKVLGLQAKQDTWGETKVLALVNPVSFKVVRDESGIVF